MNICKRKLQMTLLSLIYSRCKRSAIATFLRITHIFVHFKMSEIYNKSFHLRYLLICHQVKIERHLRTCKLSKNNRLMHFYHEYVYVRTIYTNPQIIF